MLGIPVHHYVEAIGGTANIAKAPEKTGESQETSSNRALIPTTEGSTKPVTVQVTNAGIAVVEQFDLRMP